MDKAFGAVCNADEDAEGHHVGDQTVQDLPHVNVARELLKRVGWVARSDRRASTL